MSIPMSALRRALLSALDRPGVQRVLPAPILGAGAGGAFGAAASALDGDISDAGEYAMTGATIGAGLGGIGVGAAVNRSLREALAEQAASRGVGRRAVREAADAGDAAAFAGVDRGLERRLAAFPPRVQELARAIAPIKAEKGSVGWDDLDKIQSELGSITPDELLDLRIIFSDGLSVTRVGHP